MFPAMFLCEHPQGLVVSFTHKLGERFGSPRAGGSWGPGSSPLKTCSPSSSQGRGSGTENFSKFP